MLQRRGFIGVATLAHEGAALRADCAHLADSELDGEARRFVAEHRQLILLDAGAPQPVIAARETDPQAVAAGGTPVSRGPRAGQGQAGGLGPRCFRSRRICGALWAAVEARAQVRHCRPVVGGARGRDS